MSQYLPIRVRAKLFAKRLLPTNTFNTVREVWIATGAKFVGDKKIIKKYTHIFLATNPMVVQGGPFKGMKYVDGAVGSSYLNKLIVS
jgi:hypothetical protein